MHDHLPQARIIFGSLSGVSKISLENLIEFTSKNHGGPCGPVAIEGGMRSGNSLIDGRFVIEDGHHTATLAGRAIRRAAPHQTGHG
ncbi:hypothetical protein ABZ370_41020 [Streptomyces sp. NPDC005962]|uniref:hypothetical protein n=1 Tax=Streptomyces sp. NPDC005962 TaxID=3154466 RepID=UPI0033C9564E